MTMSKRDRPMTTCRRIEREINTRMKIMGAGKDCHTGQGQIEDAASRPYVLRDTKKKGEGGDLY